MDTVERKVQEAVEPVAPARWSRAAALGLALAAAGPLLMLAAALIWGLDVSEEIMFFLVPPSVVLATAVLVWRFGTWAKILGIVVGLFLPLLFFWTAFGLFSPNAIFDFLPGVLVVPGALFGVVSCVAAIVAGRRGNRTAVAVAGERTAIRVALGVVASLAVLSGVLTVVTRPTVDASAAEATVSMKNFKFEPDSVSVDAGSTIHVRNDDPFTHTFTIDALGIDVTLPVGGEALVDVGQETGTFVYYCKPHTENPDDLSDKDMAGRLTLN